MVKKQPEAPILVPVGDAATQAAAGELIREYLGFIRDIALQHYQLSFDIDAMVESDLHDPSKFYPPTGRFYLVRHGDRSIGVGCLKALGDPRVSELQRMYVQPSSRGVGAGRILLRRLLQDATAMKFRSVRLESLRALEAAHALYRSVGFNEIDPYDENSMRDYQSSATIERYRASAIFMELALA